MPPKKATQARSKTPKKTKDDEVEDEDEEEEKPTSKRNTRNQSATKPAKAEPKTKASSAKKGTSKATTKAAAKKTTKAKKAASESESEEESPAPKSPLKKASPPKTGPAKTKAKPQAKKYSGYSASSNKRSYSGHHKQSDSEEDSDDEKPVKKQQTKRSEEGKRSKDIDLDANIELDSELVIKDNLRVLAFKGLPAYDYYEEYQDPKDSSVKMFFHMQILDSYKMKFRTHSFTFFRWGKVGEVGECSLRGFLNRKRCIKIYEDKIEERKKIATKTTKKKVQNNVNLASQGAKVCQTAMIIENKDEPQQDGQKAADNGMEEEKKKETNQVTKSQPDVKKTKEKVDQTEMEEEKKEQSNNNKEETKEQAKPPTSKLDLDKIDCPVDKYCVMRDWTEVLVKDDEIFDVKYGVSEIQKNSNQFYTFQLIRSKIDPTKHYIFTRYGRTGLIGKWTIRGTFTEEEGIAAFRAKQNERKEQNKYTALDISYAKNDPDILNKAFQESVGKSKLHKKVAEFIQFIFDFKMMGNQMALAGYDAKKLPLGNLSFNAINKGFVKLNELSEAIKNRADEATLEKLSSEFFTIIPQNVGWQNMKTMTIRSNDVIKEKLEFLDSLRQIQIAYQMVYGLDQEKENPIDTNYKKLKCDMEPVDSSSDEYVKIKEFIDNTKENYNLEILEMFKINKHGAEEAFKKDLDNHVMLWHGSRLTNFVGILSQGLRIAPPEAPVSGYRLGKGVYLADMISKSVPYCYASGSNNIFCIMVCESALGTMNEKLHDDFYASNLPAGKHSTKALGRVAPPLKSYKEFGKGIVIPSGKPEKSQHTTSSFQHNEFIVYDVNQVKIRYLLKMKQNRW